MNSKHDVDSDDSDHDNDPGVAKRLRTQYHPWQRRKLTIPNEKENEESFASAYSASDQFWLDLMAPLPHAIPKRPWPTSQVLSSTITASNPTTFLSSPLLQAFFESVGKKTPDVDAKDQKSSSEAIMDNMEQDVMMEDLDNPAFSTLTPAQHRRYWKLVQQTERRTPSERIHWKQLQALIPTEQAKYRQAVQQFWMHHKQDRLLLGFQSSSYLHGFCQWACRRTEGSSRPNHDRTPTITTTTYRYGKCRQVLSLRSTAVQEQVVLDVMTLDFTTIARENIDQIPAIATLPREGTSVMHPSSSWIELPLSQDTKALELAEQHGAQMILTDHTLETLLKIPGDGTTQWMLPMTRNQNGLVLVENPLEQMYTTPRDCLTFGLQEGLYQQMMHPSTTPTSTTDASASSSRAYIYTLWNLPTGARRSKPLRVLIRSTVRLLWQTTTTTNQPQSLKIRVHVDYFPERGQEMVSRHERCLWIVDQLLGRVSKLCRVDGRHGTILEWQDTSVAHAFATDSEEDPMAGLVQLVQFLQAVATIDFGDGNTTTSTTTAASTADSINESASRLLCLPSRETSSTGGTDSSSVPDPYSVSVHAPTKLDEDDVIIDLQVLLRHANGVLLNAKAIAECYRPWKWEVPDRIPYTFPTDSKDNTTTATTTTTTRKQSHSNKTSHNKF